MIALEHESLVSLREAAGWLPKRRANKRPHVATLYRWAQRGIRGVRLETIQVGGTRCTSREALQRFFNQLGRDGTTHQPLSKLGTLPNRSRHTAVERALDQVGL